MASPITSTEAECMNATADADLGCLADAPALSDQVGRDERLAVARQERVAGAERRGSSRASSSAGTDSPVHVASFANAPPVTPGRAPSRSDPSGRPGAAAVVPGSNDTRAVVTCSGLARRSFG